MADMAIKLIFSCAVLSSVGNAADQGCQGDHCPAAVNSLLQAGHKQPLTQMDQADETADDAEAALAQEKQEGENLGDGEEVDEDDIADDTEEDEPAALAQMGTPSGYTAHTGVECKASNGGGTSVGKKTGVTIMGKGSEADAAAECEKFGDGCHGFSYGKGRFFLKKGFDMCKCGKVAAYTAYTKTSDKVAACKTATPRPTPRPASGGYTHLGKGYCKGAPGRSRSVSCMELPQYAEKDGWGNVENPPKKKNWSVSLEKCKAACNAESECHGLSWNTADNCWLFLNAIPAKWSSWDNRHGRQMMAFHSCVSGGVWGKIKATEIDGGDGSSNADCYKKR